MKSALRSEIKALKSTFSAEELATLSAYIAENIINDADVRAAKTIVAYCSLPDEVDTHAVIDTLLADGKTVLLPVVKGSDMELHEYKGCESLHKGAYGILEPQGNPFLEYDTIDVVLVPGVAFDAAGHRLGRGKGYYDRFLPKAINAVKIGVCFPFQVVNTIPFEPHDVACDRIITYRKTEISGNTGIIRPQDI